MEAIRGIVFDAFSTLFSQPSMNADLTIITRLREEYPGLPISRQGLRDALRPYDTAFECGLDRSGNETRWSNAMQQLGVKDPPLHLLQWCMLQEVGAILVNCRPLPGIRGLFARIHAAGLHTAICTNASSAGLILENLLGLDELADEFIVSCREGKNKSDPDFLLLPSDRLGIPTANLLFADDGLPHLKNAKRMGYHTVHVLQHEGWDGLADWVRHCLPEQEVKSLEEWRRLKPDFVDYVVGDILRVVDIFGE